MTVTTLVLILFSHQFVTDIRLLKRCNMGGSLSVGLWVAESSGCITLENATEAFECTSTADICINVAGVDQIQQILAKIP